MKHPSLFCITVVGVCALPAFGQQTTPAATPQGGVPIYHVTVVQRTTKAINYQYRSLPTPIDFRGTVLLPKAKGSAVVQSKQGRTDIDAHFHDLQSPQLYGGEYLTYVLWALTPDGRPHNLGEIVTDSGDDGKLHVTTDLQAFALIITAEPYSAVRRPGDVVVMENEVRPDTVGKVEYVEAKYELMPRGEYSWQVPSSMEAAVKNAPKVSTREYEALMELYQAQNAIEIAKAAKADVYSPDTLAKATRQYNEAKQMHDRKRNSHDVVQTAREATQTAEDSRMIAVQRSQEEQLVAARADATEARNAASRVEADIQSAKAQAASAQAQADAERAARERAEADAVAARNEAARAVARATAAENARVAQPAVVVVQTNPNQQQVVDQQRKTEVRTKMLRDFALVMSTRDTPRGLVITVPDSGFNGNSLRGSASAELGRVAAMVAAHPGMRVEVEGHMDTAAGDSASSARAQAVRDAMLTRGLTSGMVSARGFGNARPLTSNASANGREENRRVEIVVSGDPIGNLPYWDSSYSLSQR